MVSNQKLRFLLRVGHRSKQSSHWSELVIIVDFDDQGLSFRLPSLLWPTNHVWYTNTVQRDAEETEYAHGRRWTPVRRSARYTAV